MAQRTVHHAFGQLLAEACGISDLPRFLLGSLLPDAICWKTERDASHYVRITPDGSRFYDFSRFRLDFSAQMPDDPLYLGYYMHLVEDNLYRLFCHRDYDLYFISDDEVRALHRDYHLLNPWLREKYRLENRLMLPSDFDLEPIARIARFDPEGLLRELDSDLSERPAGDFRFLSPAMMDEFISQSLPQLEAELRAVLRGESCLRASDFAWKRPLR